MEQRVPGTLQIWAEPFVRVRVPKLFNLRTDPYERADVTSNTYYEWMMRRSSCWCPCRSFVAQMAQTLIEFPPRQKPASFNLDRVMEKINEGMGSA